MALEERKGSSLDVVGVGITVAVGVVLAVVAFRLLAWIAGTVFFVTKMAIVAGLIFLVGRFMFRHRRSPS